MPAPIIQSVNATKLFNNTVKVIWTVPRDLTGVIILRFIIKTLYNDKKPTNIPDVALDNPATQTIINGLDVNKSYIFSVETIDALGNNSSPAYSEPLQVAAGTFTAAFDNSKSYAFGNAIATISWIKKGFYSLKNTNVPGFQRYVPNDKDSYVITKLKGGLDYSFTFATGGGVPIYTNTISVKTVPSSPTKITSTVTGNSAVITFNCLGDGGSPIQKYIVYYSTEQITEDNYSTQSVRSNTTESVTITDLTPNTRYYYIVVAVNAIGNSLANPFPLCSTFRILLSDTRSFDFTDFNALHNTKIDSISVDLLKTESLPVELPELECKITGTIPAEFTLDQQYIDDTGIYNYSWGSIKIMVPDTDVDTPVTHTTINNWIKPVYWIFSNPTVKKSDFTLKTPGTGTEPSTYTIQPKLSINYNTVQLNTTIPIAMTINTKEGFDIPDTIDLQDAGSDLQTFPWGEILSNVLFKGLILLSTLNTPHIINKKELIKGTGNNYIYNYAIDKTCPFVLAPYESDKTLPSDMDMSLQILLVRYLIIVLSVGPPVVTGFTDSQAIISALPFNPTCFLAGAPVTLADGSTKPIEEMKVGDIVLGAFGEHNTVLKCKQSVLGVGRMCKINGEHTTTLNHPHITPNKKFVFCNGAVDSKGLKLTDLHSLIVNMAPAGLHYAMFELKKGRIQSMAIGTELHAVGGPKPIETMELLSLPSTTPIYNLAVSGSHTYFVNGYAVTGDMKEDDFDVDLWTPRPHTNSASSSK